MDVQQYLTEIRERVGRASESLLSEKWFVRERPQESPPESLKPWYRVSEDAFGTDNLYPFETYTPQVTGGGKITIYKEIREENRIHYNKPIRVAITVQNTDVDWGYIRTFGFKATVNKDYRVTIPAEFRNNLDIQVGDYVQANLYFDPQFNSAEDGGESRDS